MTRNKKIIIIIIVAVLVVLAWTPWLNNQSLHDRVFEENWEPMVEKTALRKVVKTYLEENIWEPNQNGRTFCAYEVLGEEGNSNIHQYVWALCQEYYLENTKLREGGGTSLPVALTLQKENHIYKIISHRIPEDGSFYPESIKRIFPKNIRKNKMFSNDVSYHNQHIRILQDEIKKDVELYFKNPYNP